MRPFRLSVLLAVPFVLGFGSALAEEAAAVETRVTEVTVFADRARVTREGEAALTGAPQRIRFADLPSWLDESSVRVRLAGPAAGEVLDVVVETTFLAETDDAAVREAEAAVREVQDQMRVIEDRTRVLQAQQVEAIRVFTMDKFPKDAAARPVDVDEYRQVVAFLSESLTELNDRRRELDLERRALQPELSARQRRLQEIQQRARLEKKHVEALVRGAEAGAAAVQLVYQLPGTTWEPRHEARVTGDNGQVAVHSFAAVTQTTGEDWTDVAITFSTRSPDEAMTIPELTTMLVGRDVTVAAPRPAASKSSWDSANRRFVAVNALVYNLRNEDVREQAAYADNWNRQVVVQQRVQARFEEIRKRGTTALFRGEGRVTVRADGREVRVPVGRLEVDADLATVAVPSVSLNAVNTALIRNAGDQPLLPGTMALFRDGDFLGSTEVEFVAPGETFALFMGLADEIKVSRTLDRRQSSANWTGSRRRIRVLFSIELDNLGGSPRVVDLKDQIPVSENRDIRVTDVALDPRARPDDQGMVVWKVELAPGARRQVQVGYTVDYPRDYLAQRAAAPQAEGLPASPTYRLDRQLMELEANF